MRHRKSGRRLNCNSSHRSSMFRNMVNSLILNHVIKTTLPKAKELRKIIEPLITLSKKESIANRRLAFSRTRNNKTVSVLFNQLGPYFINYSGGYTRILKCRTRLGDNAKMAYIELIKHDKLKKTVISS